MKCLTSALQHNFMLLVTYLNVREGVNYEAALSNNFLLFAAQYNVRTLPLPHLLSLPSPWRSKTPLLLILHSDTSKTYAQERPTAPTPPQHTWTQSAT